MRANTTIQPTIGAGPVSALQRVVLAPTAADRVAVIRTTRDAKYERWQ